jgi:hypothetical protein
MWLEFYYVFANFLLLHFEPCMGSQVAVVARGWKEPFAKCTRTLTWEEAMKEFRRSHRQARPRYLGDYPPGQCNSFETEGFRASTRPLA